MSFKCMLPGCVEFGPGKIAELAALVEGKNVLLLSDKGLAATGLAARAASLCRSTAKSVREFFDVPAEPSDVEVAAVLEAVQGSAPDCLVAIGGGSVLDMAKLVAVMLGDGPSIDDLFNGVAPGPKKAGLIMLPTTAGTGSEATPNSIIYRTRDQLKVGIISEHFLPDRVILDPELLVGLPPKGTAYTGLDALCHALECLVSTKANPFSDMFAMESLRLIFGSLRKSFHDGSDLRARGDMLLASFYAGICIAASGTTAVHALSYPLGGRYRIPHGLSNAMLLAPVFAFNKDSCSEKLATVAEFLGKDLTGLSCAAKADFLVAELAALSRELDVPESLRELGIPADDLPSIRDAAFEVKRLLNNNPKTMSLDDIEGIYKGLML